MAANAEATVTLSLIDRVTGPIKRIGDRIGGLSKRIGLERLGASVGNLGARFMGLGESIGRTSMRLGALFGLLGASGAGVIASAYGLAKSVADMGGELDDTANRLKIGVESLQEWRYAAKLSGLENATFEKGVEKLGINAVGAAKGNKELAKAFASLGVKVKGAHGKMRPMEDILDDTMASLANLKDPLRQNALAFQLFGKAGVGLVQMMADGASGISKLRSEARRLGVILGDDAVKAGAEFGDQTDRLSVRLTGLKYLIGAQLLPVFNEAIQGISDWLEANSQLIRSGITDWVKSLTGFIKQLVDPTSEVRTKMREFGASISYAYGYAKPFVDFVGGPFKAALLLLGLWALAPAITAITLLGGAFLGLGKAIAGVGVSTIVSMSGAIADVAGAGLAKSLEAAGSTAGGLYGKAFAIAVRLAIIAGVGAATMGVLQQFDPKGNLGGVTKPVDDWLRNKLGLPAKDTGITPSELLIRCLCDLDS